MRLLPPLAALLLLSGCIQYRSLRNFNEGSPFPAGAEDILAPSPLRIQPDDLLAISVQAVDPAATTPFNFSGTDGAGATAKTNQSAQSGGGQHYLVDNQGDINFPGLGRVRAAGLSTLALRDTLTNRLERYIQTPIVNVALLNFRFTVLGEVNTAGTFTVTQERVSILEAIGMAGDLTNYGNRENVLVVREEAGQRYYAYLNLHDREVFKSPYFYLRQNDIIYVEPLKAKLGATVDATNKYLQVALPIVSVISLIISLVK